MFKKVPLLCYDCHKDLRVSKEHYSLRSNVWRKAWPTYEEDKKVAVQRFSEERPERYLLLCIACLTKRLGRQLTAKDFHADAPMLEHLAEYVRNSLP